MKYLKILFILASIFLITGCFYKKQEEVATQIPEPEVKNITDIPKTEVEDVYQEGDELISDEEIAQLDEYLDNDEDAKAKEYGLTLNEKYSANTRILSRLGRAYINLKEYDNALKILLEASELVQDTDTNILFNIARVYDKTGDTQNAKKYIDMILLLEPENERALAFFKVKNNNGENNAEANNDDVDKRWGVGEIETLYSGEIQEITSFLDKKDLPEARKVVDNILEKTDTEEVRKYIANLYNEKGHSAHSEHTVDAFKQAEVLYKESLEIYAQSEDASRLYYHNSESKDIRERIDLVYSILTDTNRDNSEAKEILDDMKTTYPDESSITAAYGRYYFEEKDFDTSLKYYNTANEQFDYEDPVILYMLGVLHYNLGDGVTGKEYIKKAQTIGTGEQYPDYVKDKVGSTQ